MNFAIDCVSVAFAVLREINVTEFKSASLRWIAPNGELPSPTEVFVGALLVAVQAAHPWMSAGAHVSATGSMAADEPWHRAASLGVQKAGLRNLVISLDRTLEPDGIRAVSVTVRGSLSSEGTFTPDKVAEAILAATRQDPHEWRAEVSYP